MSEDVLAEKLERYFHECDKHLLRVSQAYEQLSSVMPLDVNCYLALSDEEVKTMDQFLFRFAKLQDTMGKKLFKAMLLFLGEDVENMPFVDILNKMEKLHLLDNATDWKELREDRNELAHNYDDEPESMTIAINQLYKKKVLIEKIYLHIKNYYENKK